MSVVLLTSHSASCAIHYSGCYNRHMPKPKAKADDADEFDDESSGESRGDDGDADDQQIVDLTPVGKKIPESKDNLRQRSDYFKKRH